MVTYGDGLADIDIDALLGFHKQAGTIGTFTGVRMPSRFGTVRTDRGWQDIVVGRKASARRIYKLRLLCSSANFWITWTRAIPRSGKEPLQALAAEGQLSMYPHPGQWRCMDTLRILSG